MKSWRNAILISMIAGSLLLVLGCDSSGGGLSSKVPDAPPPKSGAEKPAGAPANRVSVGKKGAAPMMPPP